MPISNRARTKARHRVTALRKRHKRWLHKRDAQLFKWALEGIDVELIKSTLFVWDITLAQQQLQQAIRQYKALK